MLIQRNSAFLATLLMLNLSGCALFGNKSENSPATLRAALEVPPDLARPASDDLAAVPPGGAAAYSDYTAKTPAANTVVGVSAPANAKATPAVPASSSVRLERDGNQRWLVVQDAPDRAMERVRSHLASRNMELAVDDPKSGIFETEWKERKINLGTNALTRMLSSLQSTGLRDKFRIRVEPGRAAGTSEVYVSHQGLEEVVIGNNISGPGSTWQPRATDLQAEAELLSALMTSFGMNEQEVKDQAGKVATGSALKVKDGLLLQQQDMDQAWRRVGQALDRSGFAIEDRDRGRGVYYVYDRSAAGAAKKNTLFSGWLSIGERAEAIEDRFQVVLTAAEGGIGMKVLNVKGERTESKNGERLLEYLQQQLQ
ncbi:MAG: outer membrane protein assembly factor BamC [Pseudomonadota bacterium]